MPKKPVPNQEQRSAVSPVKVTARANGQEFVGCIMPLG
jgi:hypothetical protein